MWKPRQVCPDGASTWCDGNGDGNVSGGWLWGWVVGVVVGRVEGGADGVSLEAESYVGVDGGGDADVGVAEEFFDHDEVDALFQEQGGGGVPEVVEADAAEAGPVEEAAEASGEVGWVEGPACRHGEDETARFP
jgi:hypothetical protein